MRSDGVLITIGITTTTTAAVGATAKTTVELLLSMRVSEEEIDKVTTLFDCPQSFARNIARYALLLPLDLQAISLQWGS